MKIAAYLNAQGELSPLHSGGAFRLFAKTPAGWVGECDVAVPFHEAMTLNEFVVGLHEAITQLGDCRVVILAELRGMLKALLEERGLRTWKSSGSLGRQLDDVEIKEEELAKQPPAHPCPVFLPTCIGDTGDGHYQVNLVEVLRSETHPASRDILLPFLAAGPFRLLEIRCDHLPRWFKATAQAMELNYQIGEPEADGTFVITVSLDPASVAGRSMATYLAHARSNRHHGCSGC